MSADELSLIEPAWVSLPDGERADPVWLSSSVRVLRNIKGYRFPSTCAKSTLLDTAAMLLGTVGRCDEWDGCDFRQMDALDELSRGLLAEARVITQEFAGGGTGRFVMRSDDGAASCMINSYDHLAVEVCLPGDSASDAASRAEAIASTADAVCDPVLGYLTADPRCVGSGARVCAVLHLPALDATGDLRRAASALERDWPRTMLGRMTYDGDNSAGSFYVVSNRITLGVTIAETAAFVSAAARCLVSKELFARHKMQHAKNADMSDRFWRTWGMLRYARKLSYIEAANKASFAKLGCDMGVLPPCGERDWRRLMVRMQRYHMSAAAARLLDPSEEPHVRASMFRRFIENCGNSVVCRSDCDKELR